ncbi:MAG: hypothetical protein WC070_04920 [Candidatus Magasanikbacteria bacterium]
MRDKPFDFSIRSESEGIIGLSDSIEDVNSHSEKESSPDLEKCQRIIWKKILEDKDFFKGLSKFSISAKTIAKMNGLRLPYQATREDIQKCSSKKEIRDIKKLLFDKIIDQINVYNLENGYFPFPTVLPDINFEESEKFQFDVFVNNGLQKVTFLCTLSYECVYGYDCPILEVIDIVQYSQSVYDFNTLNT